MKNRDIYWRRYKKHCTQDNDNSVPFTLGPHTILLITISCPVIFSWVSSMVLNLFPFKVILVLGKARSRGVPNLDCRGAESPGWLDVLPKTSVCDVMHEGTFCHDEDANHQLPIAAALWIIPIVSTEECSSLKLNHADSSLNLLRHFECNGHTVHMLT